jgi:predicted TIM-barrel fold metal-dependent hydrolase
MDRVYFGSDQCLWPDLIRRAVVNTRANLKDDEIQKVFRKNAAQLFGLKP